jgi:DNA polymerase IV
MARRSYGRRLGHRRRWAAVGALAIRRPTCERTFVSGEATILHADVDAFYASVEQRDDPRLRGRPVIVGAGVVLAASYEARMHGVRTAMGGGLARRLCPQAVILKPRMSAYSEASKAMFEVFADTAPLVEGLSIDEAFLDVRGLGRIGGTPAEIAGRLRREVRERVGLPITVGVARTKFLAKVASGVAKPDGLLVVAPERELAFLHPLPVECLWGVGRVTARKLHDRGLTTVRQVAQLPEGTLVSMLGRAAGRKLHALAHNRDPRPVRTNRRRRTIGSQRALGRAPRSPDDLDAVLVGIVDRLTRRLRSARRVCRTVVLRLRFDDFSRASRSHTLPQATAATEVVLVTARGLMTAALPIIQRRGLTLVGLTLSNLDGDGAVQLTLPFDRPRAGVLDATLDRLRERFGSTAITRGVLVGRDPGLSVPLLPD